MHCGGFGTEKPKYQCVKTHEKIGVFFMCETLVTLVSWCDEKKNGTATPN